MKSSMSAILCSNIQTFCHREQNEMEVIELRTEIVHKHSTPSTFLLWLPSLTGQATESNQDLL